MHVLEQVPVDSSATPHFLPMCMYIRYLSILDPCQPQHSRFLLLLVTGESMCIQTLSLYPQLVGQGVLGHQQ